MQDVSKLIISFVPGLDASSSSSSSFFFFKKEQSNNLYPIT
jgi:hypothetical protein